MVAVSHADERRPNGTYKYPFPRAVGRAPRIAAHLKVKRMMASISRRLPTATNLALASCDCLPFVFSFHLCLFTKDPCELVC